MHALSPIGMLALLRVTVDGIRLVGSIASSMQTTHHQNGWMRLVKQWHFGVEEVYSHYIVGKCDWIGHGWSEGMRGDVVLSHKMGCESRVPSSGIHSGQWWLVVDDGYAVRTWAAVALTGLCKKPGTASAHLLRTGIPWRRGGRATSPRRRATLDEMRLHANEIESFSLSFFGQIARGFQGTRVLLTRTGIDLAKRRRSPVRTHAYAICVLLVLLLRISPYVPAQFYYKLIRFEAWLRRWLGVGELFAVRRYGVWMRRSGSCIRMIHGMQ